MLKGRNYKDHHKTAVFYPNLSLQPEYRSQRPKTRKHGLSQNSIVGRYVKLRY